MKLPVIIIIITTYQVLDWCHPVEGIDTVLFVEHRLPFGLC
jgi:hypothetical protein